MNIAGVRWIEALQDALDSALAGINQVHATFADANVEEKDQTQSLQESSCWHLDSSQMTQDILHEA